jgi:DNA-binding NarL/FixJ family response regulator
MIALHERRVLERAASGYTDEEIADFLGIGTTAVRMTFSCLYDKLGIAQEWKRADARALRREAIRQYFTGEAFDE